MTTGTLGIDVLLHSIMERRGIDIPTIVRELNWHKEQGEYLFSSGRRLGNFPTRHKQIRSLPYDFPPLLVKVGRNKRTLVTIDRFYLTNSTRVNYTANSSCSTYILPSVKLPVAFTEGLKGESISRAIEGIPDDREILRVHSWMKQIEINVPSQFINYEESSEKFDPDWEITEEELTFLEGKRLRLRDVRDIDPDAKGARIFKRRRIEYCSFCVNTAQGRQTYIAALPVDKAKEPLFNAKGFYRDNHLECHIANVKDVDHAQVAATMSAAGSIGINEGLLPTRLKTKLALEDHRDAKA